MNEMEARLATPEQIRNWLRTAIHAAGAKDISLWEEDASEQSRVARVAHYLEIQVPCSLDVDIEYNRQVRGQDHGSHQPNPKNVKQHRNASGELKNGRPDLLLHQRGRNQQNLLVAEFKNTKENLDEWNADLTKVEYWFDTFDYSLGCVVAFGPDRHTFQPTVAWFERKTDGDGLTNPLLEDVPL